jgi:hypothetical protein
MNETNWLNWKKKIRKFKVKFDNSFVWQAATLSRPIRHLRRLATELPNLELIQSNI